MILSISDKRNMVTKDPFNTPQKRYKRDKWFTFADKRKTKNCVQFINYLTFPGINCHDIIKMRPLLKPQFSTTNTGYDKTSLTFLEKDIEKVTDIRNKLSGARFFSGSLEDFVKAAKEGELVESGTEKTNYFTFFPYDVINLDFTSSAFKHGDSHTSPQMSAIHTIFELQNLKHKSFSLFLTFAGIMASDDDQGRNDVSNAIRTALANTDNSEFKNVFETKHNGVNYPYCGRSEGRSLKYTEYLLIGIPLIVINYGFSQNFEVFCRRRYRYIGDGNSAVMVSSIFDCEFVDTSDYGGNKSENLIGKKPSRLKEIFEHYEDINVLFNQNTAIKSKYSTEE